MSIIKSFSVGNGDMFYIYHNSDNFTIIDCCLSDENKEKIVDEILAELNNKIIKRFISPHPDEDHLCGLEYLDDRIGIINFYCVENEATKEDESLDF
ncbi:MBL fold metallo-hydrolase [Ammoniphilus sp. CFH 90114]|uniref:MBL fold metallo-hydrolase n=1 Tax=Ammoniphilus sp. CFH 90114 TaxID=2493665 RepID=UPI001F0C3711|nr:MBL fold metallo-hydrolase [Ammoniphilus sp. CFH 90114]